MSADHLLLIPKVLIRGHQHVESLLGGGEKFSVSQRRPPHRMSGGDFMAWKPGGQRTRNAMVQENLHAVSRTMALRACSRTATACARVTPSNASRYSPNDTPPFRFSNKLATGTRVPSKHGTPLIRSMFCQIGRPGIGLRVPSMEKTLTSDFLNANCTLDPSA